VTDEQKREIREAAVDGKLSCARAFQLSVELDLSLKVIGDFCNEEGIKVKNCQLGCFR
jgi:hypothetical protein